MQTIMLVRTAIENYRADLKRLPPGTIAGFAGTRWDGLAIQGNAANEGVECLLVALRHPDLFNPLDQLPRNPFGNTDKDAWNKRPDGFGSQNADEVLDAYGNPIVYIPHTRYAEELQVVRGDGSVAAVRGVRRRSGAFYNPDSFQIISLGANGKQDAAERVDDLENFTREPE